MRRRFPAVPTLALLLLVAPLRPVWSDGGFFAESRSVAVSSDQKAAVAVSDDEVTLTLSTAYSGDGASFAWVVPTPAPVDPETIVEAQPDIFETLEELTAPTIIIGSGGCFVAGTPVLTGDGPVAIEEIEAGDRVESYDRESDRWHLGTVVRTEQHRFSGDLVTITAGDSEIIATGNHPFFVRQGSALSSRPASADVPVAEQSPGGTGRWVEARSLQTGDLLVSRHGVTVRVTGLRQQKGETDVYNLVVSGSHTYGVGSLGLAVHNKGSAESEETVEPPVTLYATVELEHFDAAVVGARDAGELLDWLAENSYRVDRSSESVLQRYVADGWAFVAVRLTPSEHRAYENEFLPPVSMTYRSDELAFPLAISTVSSAETLRVTLYVVGPSTARTTNLPTRNLRYSPRDLIYADDPTLYVGERIASTVARRRPSFALLSRKQITDGPVLQTLGIRVRGNWEQFYVTRLETVLAPGDLDFDVRLNFQRVPRSFRVHSYGSRAAETIRNVGFVVLIVGVVLKLVLAAIVAVALPVVATRRSRAVPAATMIHLTQYAGIIGILTIWFARRRVPPELRDEICGALNYRITMFVVLWGSIGLSFFVPQALVAFPVIAIADAIVVVIVASKSRSGGPVRYPVAIPFVKRRSGR